MAKKHIEKQTVGIGIFRQRDSSWIESVSLCSEDGTPCTVGEAKMWLSDTFVKTKATEWIHIATIQVEIEPVTTMKVTAKVLP